MPAPKGNTYYKFAVNPGRPKAVSSPEVMENWFKDYCFETKNNPILVEDYVGKDATRVLREKERPLTIEGFENYVTDIGGPLSLQDYFSNRDGKYEEFSSVCAYIRRKIRDDQVAGGLAGIYNPSITQRLNGLVDKQEMKAVVEQPLFGEDPVQPTKKLPKGKIISLDPPIADE